MDTEWRPSRAGDLRVSDADRDRALAELSEHFQAGRLTAAELDDRTGRALSARTNNDLAVLLADLPAAQAPAVPAARRGGPPAWVIVAIVAAVLAGVVAVVGQDHHAHVVLVPWWLILVAFFVLRGRRRGRRPPGLNGPELSSDQPSSDQIGPRDERS